MQIKISSSIAFLCAGLQLLLTDSVMAAQNNFFSDFDFKNTTVIVQAGGFNASQGKEQHIGIDDLLGDEFTVDHAHDSNYLLGLGYYLRGFNNNRIEFLYGLNAFYLAPTTVKGNVYQEQQTSSNLSYQYHLTNYPIYLASRAIFNTQDFYNFTVDFGIGPNIIIANNFTEKSLDGITQPDDIFSSDTATTLSVTIGIGIKFQHVLGSLPLELGYRYFYLGEGQLSKENNQVLDTLKTGYNYANAFIISISF